MVERLKLNSFLIALLALSAWGAYEHRAHVSTDHLNDALKEGIAIDQLQSLSGQTLNTNTVTPSILGTPLRNLSKTVSPARWFPDYEAEKSPPALFPEEQATDKHALILSPQKLPPLSHEAEYITPFTVEGFWEMEQGTIRIPASKLEAVKLLAHAIETSKSYEEAANLLREYLWDVGVIQHFGLLRLRHSSQASPKIILKEGLLSTAIMQKSGRDILNSNMPFGNGIYFYGTGPSWSGLQMYYPHAYEVELQDINLLLLTPTTRHLINLFASIRAYFGKESDKNIYFGSSDYIPPGLMDYLRIDGVMRRQATPEIFLRRERIEPKHISYLGSRFDETGSLEP